MCVHGKGRQRKTETSIRGKRRNFMKVLVVLGRQKLHRRGNWVETDKKSKSEVICGLILLLLINVLSVHPKRSEMITFFVHNSAKVEKRVRV